MTRVQGTVATEPVSSRAGALVTRRAIAGLLGVALVGVLAVVWWSRPAEIDDEINGRNAAEIARLMEVQLDTELAIAASAQQR